MDCDKYPNLASQYGVGGLPTCILFKRGAPVLKEVRARGRATRGGEKRGVRRDVSRPDGAPLGIAQEGFIPASDLSTMIAPVLAPAPENN